MIHLENSARGATRPTLRSDREDDAEGGAAVDLRLKL
jgi:hypothetical protein